MIRADQSSEGVSIDLTPIIDMVFLLLIFFLVATTFHQTEREMQIALPHAASAGPITAQLRELVINVTADGRLIVNGSDVTDDELRAMVEQAVALNAQQKVTVRGDRDASYGDIVRALDVCKGAGIQEPYLDTIVNQD
jgi:biopolymer transport protein ExbD